MKNNQSPVYILINSAFILISPILFCSAIGYILDKFQHSSPIALITGVVVGFIIGLIRAYRLLMKK